MYIRSFASFYMNCLLRLSQLLVQFLLGCCPFSALPPVLLPSAFFLESVHQFPRAIRRVLSYLCFWPRESLSLLRVGLLLVSNLLPDCLRGLSVPFFLRPNDVFRQLFFDNLLVTFFKFCRFNSFGSDLLEFPLEGVYVDWIFSSWPVRPLVV